jgi:hypothetical protein
VDIPKDITAQKTSFHYPETVGVGWRRAWASKACARAWLPSD